MSNNNNTVVPVILSGGSGTRLWPRSRKHYPKQLLKLSGPWSMLQQTALRVAHLGAPMVVCNDEQRFLVAEQLNELEDCKPSAIILEPVARNTAPAIAVAALRAQQQDPEAIMVVLPADHLIQQDAMFRDALERAIQQAAAGHLVVFGVRPDKPETGYGYIRANSAGEDGGAVSQFVEKPAAEVAEQYLASGEYYWNSGMFVFKAAALLEELARYEPAMMEQCRAADDKAVVDLDFIRLDREAMEACPSESIDYAVMERTESAWMVPLDISWSDLGSWSSIWEVMDKDEQSNACVGDVITEDCSGCLFHADDHLIAAIGVEDLVVVDTKDALLIASRDRVQDVKTLVNQLDNRGREEHLTHREVHRPWGSYDSVDNGERYQVKRITVKPGQSLSLQMHHHRAEHWVVVQGTADVQVGEQHHMVSENESIYIPLGEKHRLTNPGKMPLHLIEVQSGSYLGEDDIVRYEDSYGRS